MIKALRQSHPNFLLPCIILAIFYWPFFFIETAIAGDVTLAWDANTEENLAGYKLYYDSDSDAEMYQGTDAAEGDSPIIIHVDDLDDKDSPAFKLTGLEEGQYYYFALTAFDTDGVESDFSNEVGTTIGEGSGGGSGGGCFISVVMKNNVSND